MATLVDRAWALAKGKMTPDLQRDINNNLSWYVTMSHLQWPIAYRLYCRSSTSTYQRLDRIILRCL